MIKKLNFLENEAYLITDKTYRKYFSSIELDEGYLLISKKPVYFADARYFTMLKEKLNGKNIDSKLYINLDSISEELKTQKITTLYLDYDSTTLTEYESYKNFNVELTNGTCYLKNCRITKSETEIEYVKKACNIIEEVINSIPNIIKVGITEKEIANYIESEAIKKGAEGLSFNTIVAFSKNSAIPHHETSDKKLEYNMPILIDTGVFFNGYASDITRNFYFGTPTNKYLDVYNKVKTANEIALQSINLGSNCKDIDLIARNYLKTFGLDTYFTHSLGHGIGLEIHEAPRLSQISTDNIQKNMAFTIEPGVYFENEFGIRIEDSVIFDGEKAVRLYNDSKDLVIIK